MAKKQTGLAVLKIDTKTTSEKTVNKPTSKERKSMLIRLPPEKHKKLKLLSVEEETTVQDLMEHAIELLFVEKGR